MFLKWLKDFSVSKKQQTSMNLIIRNIIEITYVEQVFDKFSHGKSWLKFCV